MKIILLKNVAKLGRKYETKSVSDGYALNLLIPQGLAISATPDAVKRIGTLREQSEVETKIHEELTSKNLKSLEGLTLKIVGKANDKGHLFAGLHSIDIVNELVKQAGVQLDPSFIQLKNPIKEVGDHVIEVKAGGKSAKLKVTVIKA